jgi:hypothetical protein
LTRSGNGRSRFTVRSSEPNGRIHVRFAEGAADPAFDASIRRLVRSARTASDTSSAARRSATA